jgi:hypothetical protein
MEAAASSSSQELRLKLPDGAVLHLDASHFADELNADELDGFEVKDWPSATPGLPILRAVTEDIAGPTVYRNDVGKPAVRFGYNRSLRLEGDIRSVQTVVSFHVFHQPDYNDELNYECNQFYIFSGTEQGPFHGTDGPCPGHSISSGHGAWEGAGGLAFHEGTIRLDGVESKVIETPCWVDSFKVAVVSCTAPVPDVMAHTRINRIGRDRNGHAFSGSLCEVICFDRALTVEEIDDLEGYLRRKWTRTKPTKSAAKSAATAAE